MAISGASRRRNREQNKSNRQHRRIYSCHILIRMNTYDSEERRRIALERVNLALFLSASSLGSMLAQCLRFSRQLSFLEFHRSAVIIACASVQLREASKPFAATYTFRAWTPSAPAAPSLSVSGHSSRQAESRGGLRTRHSAINKLTSACGAQAFAYAGSSHDTTLA